MALAVFFAAFAAALGSRSGSVLAHAPHPGLNFWIAVSGVPGCDTRTGDSSCHLAPASTFVVGVYLDTLPSDVPSYAGYEARLNYRGVTANRDVSSRAWPECVIPVSSYDTPDAVRFGCAKGIPPAPSSTYAGLLATNSFVCSQSGTIALAHGQDNTDVVDDSFQLHAEDPSTSETLTISCSQGGVVAPTPTPGVFRGATGLPPLDSTLGPTPAANATRVGETPVGGAAAGRQSSGGSGPAGWLIAVIVAAAVVPAVAAGALGWRRRQTRRGSNP